ncbi:MAG: response regulator [Gammaproteobacteria bacterium]
MGSNTLASEVREEQAARVNEEAVNTITVLIVDDSKIVRHTAASLLEKEGYQVSTATDGFEALSMIADDKPDLILLDIMMPRLDGYQTCALIKNHSVFTHIPILMLSSKDGLFDRARGKVVGSDDFVTKPFSRDELLHAVEFYTGRDGKRNAV